MCVYTIQLHKPAHSDLQYKTNIFQVPIFTKVGFLPPSSLVSTLSKETQLHNSKSRNCSLAVINIRGEIGLFLPIFITVMWVHEGLSMIFPYRECKKEVQLKDYEKHSEEGKCAVNLANIPDYDYEPGVGMSIPYILSRDYEWDGIFPLDTPVLDSVLDGNWHLMMFHYESVEFYLAFVFSVKKQSFFIYIFTCDSVEEAEKYEVTIWLEEMYRQHPARLVFRKKILAIDQVVDPEEEVPTSSYVEIPYHKMIRFFSITLNEDSEEYPDENNKYTVVLPVQVEGMTKKED